MSDLFSQAQEAKAEAVERVGRNAFPSWTAAAYQITRQIAFENANGFTSDEVWEELERQGIASPHEPRAMGAIFLGLARIGWIVKTGEYRDSRRPENHARPVAVWIDRRYHEPKP